MSSHAPMFSNIIGDRNDDRGAGDDAREIIAEMNDAYEDQVEAAFRGGSDSLTVMVESAAAASQHGIDGDQQSASKTTRNGNATDEAVDE